MANRIELEGHAESKGGVIYIDGKNLPQVIAVALGSSRAADGDYHLGTLRITVEKLNWEKF